MKLQQLIKSPYNKNLYYHVTDDKNLKLILKSGLKKNSWVTKGKPHKEYDKGNLVEFDLQYTKIEKDNRWKKEHNVFVTMENTPKKYITNVYKYIDKLNQRKDYTLNYMNKNPKSIEKIKQILKKKNINLEDY